MLKVNLIDDWMGFTFLFDEAHEDIFLQKTDNQQLINEDLTDFTLSLKSTKFTNRHLKTNVTLLVTLAKTMICW